MLSLGRFMLSHLCSTILPNKTSEGSETKRPRHFGWAKRTYSRRLVPCYVASISKKRNCLPSIWLLGMMLDMFEHPYGKCPWYYWWFRNPIPNHLECNIHPINNGIIYQPQLVFSPDFWLPSTVFHGFGRLSTSFGWWRVHTAGEEGVTVGRFVDSENSFRISKRPWIWNAGHEEFW